MQFIVSLGIRSKDVDREILTPQLIGVEIKAIKEHLDSGKIRQAWKRTDDISVLCLSNRRMRPNAGAFLLRHLLASQEFSRS
jgi:hypothetical protein